MLARRSCILRSPSNTLSRGNSFVRGPGCQKIPMDANRPSSKCASGLFSRGMGSFTNMQATLQLRVKNLGKEEAVTTQQNREYRIHL